MYNTTTKSYTLEDQSSKPYAWITENCDPADYQQMTDAEIYDWIDQLIAHEKEEDTRQIEEWAEKRRYPSYGYTTAQVFENADEYTAFHTQQLEDDMKDEREYVFKHLKHWIASAAETSR